MTSLFSSSRRRFVTGLASTTAIGLLNSSHSAAQSRLASIQPTLRGRHFDLNISYSAVNFTGKKRFATTVNGLLPAPTLRWQEGSEVSLTVRNQLATDSSIHWHGIILPSNMDGVPGLSFDGIKPGDSYEYRFKVNQSGTYWYHSHSGFQEQTGLYGAIVVEPKDPIPYSFDRDYVIMLSDWSDEAPEDIYANLKKSPHFYNTNERTLNDFQSEVKEKGLRSTLNERAMWNNMLMSDSDISDVTGKTYTFLMNGHTPSDGWVGKFKKGEKILLRFINAGAMTFFDVRIPGLKMTVVAADGQYVQAVTIDEFRIAPAETYDVIVEPSTEQAYTLFCQAIDRSGFARGTLTPDESLVSKLPEMDESPNLKHIDMGMIHHSHPVENLDDSGCTPEHAEMGHCQMQSHVQEFGTGIAGNGSDAQISFDHLKVNAKVDMLARGASYRLDDPGVGLRDNGRQVLTYSQLFNLDKTLDPRQPSRELVLHLTGNMNRYMWSIDGIKAMNAPPIKLNFGERIRITLVNNTMMNHPMHLHGLWSELETGDGDFIPRKHTVIVQPGSKISYLVTADARGKWAYHCHLMYHMPGMFRVVEIS